MNQENSLKLLSKYRNQLMGFAAFWILLFHEWTIINPEKSNIFSKVFINFKIFGYCGVDIFFLLSGMSLVYAINKETTLEFYKKRFKRVILPFLFMGIFYMSTKYWSFSEMLKNIFGYNFYTQTIYSFLWFGPAIMTLYLLFPIYYKLFNKSQSKLSFTLLIFEIWLFISIYFMFNIREDLFGFINRIPLFIFGIYIGYLQNNKTIKFDLPIWLLIIVNLFIGVYFCFLTNYHDYFLLVRQSNCFLPTSMMSISICFLLAKFLDILTNIKVLNILNTVINKILLFLGSISLELYCIQEDFGSLIKDYLYRNFIISDQAMNIILMVSLPLIAYLLSLLFKYFWKLYDYVSSLIKQHIQPKQ